jgi:hypothetical protein
MRVMSLSRSGLSAGNSPRFGGTAAAAFEFRRLAAVDCGELGAQQWITHGQRGSAAGNVVRANWSGCCRK